MDFMHILGQKEAIWNTIFSIFERRRGPKTSRGPGKLSPSPPSRRAWNCLVNFRSPLHVCSLTWLVLFLSDIHRFIGQVTNVQIHNSRSAARTLWRSTRVLCLDLAKVLTRAAWRIFTVRRYALHSLWNRNSVRLRLLLITNRKPNTRFRLVPKSTTLVDPEMTLDGNYALRCITHICFGANH